MSEICITSQIEQFSGLQNQNFFLLAVLLVKGKDVVGGLFLDSVHTVNQNVVFRDTAELSLILGKTHIVHLQYFFSILLLICVLVIICLVVEAVDNCTSEQI